MPSGGLVRPGRQAVSLTRHGVSPSTVCKRALFFCHFRLAQRLEETLFSGTSMMAFLSNFTVTAGKCVLPPHLCD